MTALKLAFKNLIGAGLRTWLNAGILSFSFVIIIFYNGMINGWNAQARQDTISWEIGGGQYWHPDYDPLDVYTYQDAHAQMGAGVQKLIHEHQLTPILLTQASAYPEGRMMSVLLKGIDPDQTLLKIPSEKLKTKCEEVPVIIGKRMADRLKIEKDETMLVRWRDKNGTFDALEVRIVDVFKCDVPSVDGGMIWFSLDKLSEMTGMEGEATLLVSEKGFEPVDIAGWKFRNHDFLLAELDMIIQSKKGGASLIWGMLLIIALLAIFDTQVLSIFRRQKEIGTYIALGMTRWQVVWIFTIEGTAYSIFAAILAAIYGTPIFYYFGTTGIKMPAGNTDIGIAVSEVIISEYSVGLVASTVILLILAATVVSFLPSRKIAKLKPTEALKGKIQ